MRYRAIVVLAFLGTPASGSTILFNPAVSPASQGWIYSTGSNGSSQLGAPLVETFSSTSYRMSTVGLPGTIGGPMHFWGKDVGISSGTSFDIEFRLQVHTSSYNQSDAGIGFSLAMTSAAPPFFFDLNMRRTMIFFAEDRIGFGDFAQVFLVPATEINHYRLSVTASNQLRVFVNDVLALTRSNFISTGVIGFGDSTNDPGVDGAFSIGPITYTDTVVPEPGTAALCLMLLLCLPARYVYRSRLIETSSRRGLTTRPS